MAGLEAPENLARQIGVVIDGAFSLMLVHRDSSYARAAGTAAKALVTGAQRVS